MCVAADLARALGALATAMSVFVVASCATVRPLDLSAGPPVLEEGEGILVVHVSTELPLKSVETTAGEVAADLGVGEHVQLLVARAGTYHWTRLTRLRGDLTLWYRPNVDEDQLAFTVWPGVINYPGMVIVRKPWSWYGKDHDPWSIHLRILNRSAASFQELARRHPSLVEQFAVRYSGPARDDFLDRYLEALHRRSSETEVEVDPD